MFSGTVSEERWVALSGLDFDELFSETVLLAATALLTMAALRIGGTSD